MSIKWQVWIKYGILRWKTCSWKTILHPLLVIALEELIDHVEQLLLVDLVVEALQKLLHRSEVGLDLLLGVLVHAEPHLGGLAAGHEALDSSHVLHAGHVVHVVKLGGLVLSDLMAAVKDGEVLLLEPLAGHLNRDSMMSFK